MDGSPQDCGNEQIACPGDMRETPRKVRETCVLPCVKLAKRSRNVPRNSRNVPRNVASPASHTGRRGKARTPLLVSGLSRSSLLSCRRSGRRRGGPLPRAVSTFRPEFFPRSVAVSHRCHLPGPGASHGRHRRLHCIKGALQALLLACPDASPYL